MHTSPSSGNINGMSNEQVTIGSNCSSMDTQSPALVGAIDQGTSSTRFLVFVAETGELVTHDQIEITKIVPKEGWVEIDPMAIMNSVYKTIDTVEQKLKDMEINIREAVKCIGICNQRESTVVWDPVTGVPYYNVIVWMDNRTKDIVDEMIDSVPGRDFNCYKNKTGLPMSTYFSAFKLKWLLNNVNEVREAAKNNRLLFGTVDSWILWNLTGRHLTDVTNASRTFLMDIETLQWDRSLCKMLSIPMKILPVIKSSADDFGHIIHGPLKGIPITGVIGDQSGALIGQNCLRLGQTKATFGTGCFIMQNIGPGPLHGALKHISREAKRGLITTVGYKLGDKPACYALEGSVKIAGAAITWLRDNMKLISTYEECDELVNKTSHSAGVFFVPALGGLYSPYWDPNAAGLFIGLSQFTKKEHMVRATLDSIAFQTNDILSIMRGVHRGLMIDGGLCKSSNMCQILADVTGCDIVRPIMTETSALGAAMLAGHGAGIVDLYVAEHNHNNHHPLPIVSSNGQLSNHTNDDCHGHASGQANGYRRSRSNSQSSGFGNGSSNGFSNGPSIGLSNGLCDGLTKVGQTNGMNATNGKEQSPKRMPVVECDDICKALITPEYRAELTETWHQAVERSMKWTKVHHEQLREIDYQRLSSLPITMYILLSLGLTALSGSIGKA